MLIRVRVACSVTFCLNLRPIFTIWPRVRKCLRYIFSVLIVPIVVRVAAELIVERICVWLM